MKQADIDSSGFQNIVLMLIGVLIIMLVSNVLTIISNPDNIKIDALITGVTYGADDDAEKEFIPPKFQNLTQDPVYVDVEPTKLTIYYKTIKEVSARDLMFEGNDFEKFLDEIEPTKERRYVVLLLRPGSAVFQRKLRQVIQERGIDGVRAVETDRPIELEAREGEEAQEPRGGRSSRNARRARSITWPAQTLILARLPTS